MRHWPVAINYKQDFKPEAAETFAENVQVLAGPKE